MCSAALGFLLCRDWRVRRRVGVRLECVGFDPPQVPGARSSRWPGRPVRARRGPITALVARPRCAEFFARGVPRVAWFAAMRASGCALPVLYARLSMCASETPTPRPSARTLPGRNAGTTLHVGGCAPEVHPWISLVRDVPCQAMFLAPEKGGVSFLWAVASCEDALHSTLALLHASPRELTRPPGCSKRSANSLAGISFCVCRQYIRWWKALPTVGTGKKSWARAQIALPGAGVSYCYFFPVP